ncbi:MAG: ribosome silencing factor [Thermoanaerobacterales bacterium]|nr:ribosome silencing factor [Thermoanaerobacterales bacterium]
MTKDAKSCANFAVSALEDKKGQDVVVLDITKDSIVADYFVIATGVSPLHVKALADEVEKRLLKEGFELRGKEGYKEANGVLLDFYDVVVHIFHGPEREYYMIERLWSDGHQQLRHREGHREGQFIY